MRLNIVDAKWYALAYKEGLSKTFIHHVALDEDTETMRITDDARTLTWRAGAENDSGTPTPVLGFSGARSLGRIEEKSFRKTYAFDEKGDYGKIVDYTFDSTEGRNLIRAAAQDQGWQEKMGGIQKFGIVAAGIGALIAVVVVLMLVLAF